MSFAEAVKSVFKKYATFSGRARRSEYWYFTLFNVAVSFLIGFILGSDKNTFGDAVSRLYSLVVLIPGLAVTWRRLHDVGKSGKTAILPYASFLISSILIVIGVMTESSLLSMISAVAMIASLVLLIKLLVLLAKDGQPGANEYGANPKESAGSSNPVSYTAPNREEKNYAFQRDDSPVDEIQAVVEGTGDKGKVSLWGEENETIPPSAVQPQKDVLRCSSCGALLEEGQKFCSLCGTKQ